MSFSSDGWEIWMPYSHRHTLKAPNFLGVAEFLYIFFFFYSKYIKMASTSLYERRIIRNTEMEHGVHFQLRASRF
jgi:hypothetical protein